MQFAFINTLLIIVLHLGTKMGSGLAANMEDIDYEGYVCEIAPRFKSPFVKAFHSSSSKGKIPCVLPTEVHVIQLTRGIKPRRSDQHTPVASLKISPVQNNDVLNGEFVFVLASKWPVVWDISIQRLNTSRYQIWVTNNSEIVGSSANESNIHKYHLLKNQLAADWTLAKFGLITSVTNYTSIKRTINGIVGSGSSPDQRCAGQQVVTEQEIEGCASSVYNSPRDVHIIELFSNDSARGRGRSVSIDIHPMSKLLQRKYLVLVLKAHTPTQWKILTRGFRGNLDVITDHTVDTNEIDLQSVRVVNERLSDLSGSQLVGWTAEKYGTPSSYSGARIADSFELIVSGDLVPETTTDSDRNVLPEDLRNLADGLKTSALNVACQANGITINLQKDLLQPYRLSRSQLSLNDQACIPQDNPSFFTWTTLVAGCGTLQQLHSSHLTYSNAVHIKLPRRSESLDLDSSGSGFYAPDRDGETLTDDEDVAVRSRDVAVRSRDDTIRLDFSCDYTFSGLPVSSVPKVTYRLGLFKDKNYQHELVSFPSRFGEQQTLYVEASLDRPGENLKALIDNCSIIPLEEDHSSAKQHWLIVNGCSKDEKVKWQSPDATSTHSVRFEFVLQKFWSNVNSMALFCELSTCSTGPTPVVGIQQCPTLRNTRDGCFWPRVRSQTSSKSLGPLFLFQATPNNNENSIPPAVDKIAGGCDEVIYIDGLSQPTVVGIAIAAFLIGAFLVGTLWIIYNRTERRKSHLRNRKLTDNSGDSTPDSAATLFVAHATPRTSNDGVI